MKHFLRALAVLAALGAGHASAQSVFVSGQVARIYPAGGAIYFRLKADSCNAGNAYYVIPADNVNLKPWSALLLTAAETGNAVTVAVPSAPACGSTDNKPINYLLRDY